MLQYHRNLQQSNDFQLTKPGFQLVTQNQQPQSVSVSEKRPQPQLYESLHRKTIRKLSIIKDFILQDSQKQDCSLSSSSEITNQEDHHKMYKLPSIEYIVQECERKARLDTFMNSKLHKLQDFYENKPNCSSREIISQKTLDSGNHQLSQLNSDPNTRRRQLSLIKNPISAYEPYPQQLSTLTIQKQSSEKAVRSISNTLRSTQGTKVQDRKGKEQRQLKLLKQQSKGLQQLYHGLKHLKGVKDARKQLQAQNMLLLKSIIQTLNLLH